MKARCELATIDYQHHKKRDYERTQDGSVRWGNTTFINGKMRIFFFNYQDIAMLFIIVLTLILIFSV